MQIERQIDREQLVRALCEGRTFQEVSTESSVPLKRAMAYRLLRAVRTKGNIALQDGRHGHPSKLRGEARAFLEACCRKTPCTPSPTLQTALRERFDLHVSVSQINRVRAALGVSNPSRRSPREKKQEKQGLFQQSQSGKKEEAACCCWRLFRKQSCFPPWRRLSLQTSPQLIHRCVLAEANLQPDVVSCLPSCSCLLCRWAPQACLYRCAHSSWTDRTYGKSPGLPCSGGLARSGGASLAYDYSSGRPASDAGTATHPLAL